jgi:hypothetical protein
MRKFPAVAETKQKIGGTSFLPHPAACVREISVNACIEAESRSIDSTQLDSRAESNSRMFRIANGQPPRAEASCMLSHVDLSRDYTQLSWLS